MIVNAKGILATLSVVASARARRVVWLQGAVMRSCNSLATGGGWPICSAPNSNVSQPVCSGGFLGLPMQCSVNIMTSNGAQAFHYTLPY